MGDEEHREKKKNPEKKIMKKKSIFVYVKRVPGILCEILWQIKTLQAVLHYDFI